MMFSSDLSVINTLQLQNVANFKNEISYNGAYNEWFKDLSDYRKVLMKYIEYKFCDYYCIKRKRIVSGDILDHHVGAYLAPMDFTRIGWNKVKSKPSQQIVLLDKFFKLRGIRFIYVALPCKGMVYPNLMVDKELLNGKSINVPQWRKMLYEIVDAGVEVIDCLPRFIINKNEILYSKEHNLSPFGCDFTAHLIATYLKKTIIGEVNIDLSRFSQIDRLYNIHSTMQGEGAVDEFEVQKYIGKQVFDAVDNEPYTGFLADSGIGIFGNCNLQSYMYDGGGITANLSYYLGYPVSYLGRKLPFSDKPQERIDDKTLELFCKKKILIYVGFPSASFVRTSINNSLFMKIYTTIKKRETSLYGSWSDSKLF